MNPHQEISFDEIFFHYQKKVFNITLNMVQGIEDAEDITQDVFLEIHRSLHTFNHQSLVSTWIYRITVNKCLDFQKAKRAKKRFAFITHLFHPDTGEQLHELPSFVHPGIALERKEDYRLLYLAISKLNEKQQTAFVLSQIQHVPQKEIAAIMMMNEKAIESLIQRAKSNLRKELFHLRRK